MNVLRGWLESQRYMKKVRETERLGRKQQRPGVGWRRAAAVLGSIFIVGGNEDYFFCSKEKAKS